MDSAAIGRLNQALYFARLHCRRAESLTDQPRQCQAALESSLDCLYRALFFLSFSIIPDRKDRASLDGSPDSWLECLASVQKRSPSPQQAQLLQALMHPGQLAELLAAQRALFSCADTLVSAQAIPLLDISLSPQRCWQWGECITQLVEQFQRDSREE